MAKAKKKKFHSIILLCAVAVFAFYVCFSFIRLQIKVNQSENTKAELEAQLNDIQLNNQELDRLLSQGNEAEIIERIAREERGYVYADEKAYIDATP